MTADLKRFCPLSQTKSFRLTRECINHYTTMELQFQMTNQVLNYIYTIQKVRVHKFTLSLGVLGGGGGGGSAGRGGGG